ncbi:YHYH domain-containing protein [Variovorax gossypii]|uniref:YHYH domain-containing protein n=1 Tax=Variovorax gossypii TaxID=1679495 RepID=A0A3S0GWD8_9BURK|nr:YHYH domain-containing protein [Variovorax gossypii]RTQ33676.1 YHYH domain-containing protein [Variovorax gossypii]
MKKVAVLIAALCLSCGALAHSGGADKNGCHRDHKNGGSHCH